MPCSGRCGESKCPEFCLCTEVRDSYNLPPCIHVAHLSRGHYVIQFILSPVHIISVNFNVNSLSLSLMLLLPLFRFSFALAILLLLLASCCKMSSTYRPPSVTTALLYSLSLSLCVAVCRSQCLLKSVNASPYLQGFMFCIQQLACIFSIVACITGMEELQEASQILSCFADLVYCT